MRRDDDRLAELQTLLRQFVAERDWAQFHDPKNLAMTIASEAGELLAKLRWVKGDDADAFVRDREHRESIEHEVADVGIALLLFCDRAGIDVVEAIKTKLSINAERYPADASRGVAERPGLRLHRSPPASVEPRGWPPVSLAGDRRFSRYIGIDYSGAETPTSSLKGLRVYETTGDDDPIEVQPPASARHYWTRKGLAEWLASELSSGAPTIVGIDHAFSFPKRYFETYHIEPTWDAFLEDFCRHWPTDEDHTYVDFVRDGVAGDGAARGGNTRWRRVTETRNRAKSVFHFDVPGSVAKSSHAGIPWLRRLRRELGSRVHFWPFDGWDPPRGKSVIAEVYPALWSASYPRGERTPDQHDAYSTAAWMRDADAGGVLEVALRPESPFHEEAAAASMEGWILGVT